MTSVLQEAKQVKTLLFFSCEPGGAEVLIPVIELVKQEPNYRVVVLAYGLGAERFARRGIEYVEIENVVRGDPAIFQTYHPHLLITSATSLPERDMSEKFLWEIARQQGIASLAFLDQWQNYAVRFSGTKDSERLAYLPDYINCIDEIGETEMLREGFPSQCLIRLGHPYLSDIQNRVSMMNGEGIRSRLSIPDDRKVFLFVSEPILEHYGSSRGYDQYQALEFFLGFVSKVPEPILPVIKLHPKDQRNRFDQLLNSFDGFCTPVILGGEISPQETLVIADYVFGMTSIMLIEGYVMGKVVVSLQPNLCIEDPLVLSRHHLIPCVLSYDEDIFMLIDRFKSDESVELEYQYSSYRFNKLLNEI